MVAMLVRYQHIEGLLPVQQIVEQSPTLPIIVEHDGKTVGFEQKTAMKKIGQFHHIICLSIKNSSRITMVYR